MTRGSQGGHSASPHKEKTIKEFEHHIRSNLRKVDPELPELVTIEKDKVLSALKSRERLRKDKVTAGKIRTMIELREQLMGNEPGRLVHGRALLQPVVPHHKKNSKTNDYLSRGGTQVGMTSIKE